MKKFRIVLVSMICVMAILLAGCIRDEQTFIVDENNNVTMTVKFFFNKEKTDTYIAEASEEDAAFLEDTFSECDIQSIQETDYYVMESLTECTAEDIQAELPNYLITKDKFYCYSADSEEDTGTDDLETLEDIGISADDIEAIVIRVQLPTEIVKTNGTLSEDKTVAEWDITETMQDSTITELEMYAYSANDAGDPEADRKTVEEQISAAEDSSFQDDHTSIYDDDLQTTPTPVPSSQNSDTVKLATPTPKPTAASQNTSQVNTTKKDTKAPVIKGVKKNKTYKNRVTVYAKDNKKLKKVTINGKKVKLKKVKKGKYKGYYKFTVKKKGKNVLIAYDAAGNKKKITFQIK